MMDVGEGCGGGAGVIAVQKAGGAQAGWRVSASGVVTSLEAAPAVVKKLKLVGHPFKVIPLSSPAPHMPLYTASPVAPHLDATDD